MKKFFIAAILTGLILCFYGCGTEGSQSASSSASQQSSSQMAGVKNPMQKVEKKDLETKLGFVMTEPEGAQEVSYYLFDDGLAQISFTMDGHKYTFRASATQKDFSGVYEEFKEEKTTSGDITVRYTTSGGSLGEWTLAENGTNFALYCPDSDVLSLCETLSKLNIPAEG